MNKADPTRMETTAAVSSGNKNADMEKVPVSPRVTDVSQGPPLPTFQDDGNNDATDKERTNSNLSQDDEAKRKSVKSPQSSNNNNGMVEDDTVRLTPNSSVLQGKVYRLDQATEILVPRLSADPQSPNVSDDDDTTNNDNRQNDNGFDSDSSDDESSYFNDPNHLPSPKSASRRYSWTSNEAAAAAAPNHVPKQRRSHTGSIDYGRESDASLSFSDESDSDNHHHHQAAPGAPSVGHNRKNTNSNSRSSNDKSPSSGRQKSVTDLRAPQQIVRMHSLSSLVSTSSQNSDDFDETDNNATGAPSSSNMMGHPPAHFFAPPPPPPHQWMGGARGVSEHTLQYSEDGSSSHRHGGGVAAFGSNSAGGGSTSAGNNNNNLLDPSSNSTLRSLQGTQQLPSSDTLQSHAYSAASVASRELNSELMKERNNAGGELEESRDFKVYWQRWIMLFYMSVLNLLSDWTCYSVAPIAVMTEEAFGKINPELLVTVFLCANAVTTICEPILLSRLGLRRTVIFGALLLMIGSIVKSGGMPPIIHADIEKGKGVWQVYLGFFLVGLSQPLYQCTPALLSASWFPERERTMATGVALNANQLGIGFAFVFGTLLVANSDDIPNYFGLLSILSTVAFLGTLIQFEDAPPTPPSDTARVMRGTLPKGPDWGSLVNSVRGIAGVEAGAPQEPQQQQTQQGGAQRRKKSRSSSGGTKQKSKSSSSRRKASSSNARRRNVTPNPDSAPATAGLRPSAAQFGSVREIFQAPSPMMPGPVGNRNNDASAAAEPSEHASQTSVDETDTSNNAGDTPVAANSGELPGYPYAMSAPYNQFAPPHYPGLHSPPQFQYQGYGPPPPYAVPPQQPIWDPHNQQWVLPPPTQQPPASFDPYYYNSYQHNPLPPYPVQNPAYYPYDTISSVATAPILDEGAEPVLRMTPYHLDIEIRDDQVMRSIRACLRRPGFIHALVSFTVSGIVINTLSTFMDYLVRLNGVGREYTGIVGGSFQFCIMCSSLIIGKITDNSRAYYSVTIGMLVLGAFGLAQCGVSLDGDRGTELRWSLVIVAVLVGPLQPVSTELGVEVAYPLSENTVLVIQQLFSNLLSAMFIPIFKAMKSIGSTPLNESDANYSSSSYQRPEFTVSFYVLIVLHAAATVCFATFNGRYLRYEHELDKKAADEAKQNSQRPHQYSDTPVVAPHPLQQPYPSV